MRTFAPDTNFEDIFRDIEYLLKDDQTAYVRNILTDLHSADIADLIERLDPDNSNKVFAMLSGEVASEVLAELEDASKDDILDELDSARIAELVEEMDSDDAADIVSELDDKKASEVLAQVEDPQEIQELMDYPEDSAGGIMAKEYVAVQAEANVEDAIQTLRRLKEEVEDIYGCYVIDELGRLVGFVSLKELILAKPYSRLRQIMEEDVFPIKSDLDQEEVAQIFERYDLVSAPVVNDKNVLIGRITIDDIIDVINEETDEDLNRIAGIQEEEILEDSVFSIARSRLPWLIIAFFGEIMSAMIMDFYSATISQIIVSAFFIPVVMAMGGSVGQQSSIIVVRGLATGEIGPRDLKRRIWREFRTAMITGSVIALLIFTVINVWQNAFNFAVVLAVGLLIIVLNASLFGAMIPFGLKKFKVDPALATGPFVATFNDVIGLLIYFSLLTLSLNQQII